MGTLRLEIESGRYKKIPADQRLCKNCKLQCVENELHFLFICDRHSVLRQSFLTSISNYVPNFTSKSDLDKFIFLMNTEDTYLLNTFSRYISSCL